MSDTDAPANARYNLTPAQYRDHRALAMAMGNLWENNGWMVWDSVAGEDLLLWISPYRLYGGEPGGPYAVGDVALSQTLFMKARRASASMEANPFLCVGYDLGDHLPGDALEVTQTAQETTWRIGKRKITAAPPVWRIRGEHAGVNADLELTAMGEAFWFTNPEHTVEDTEELWFVACARAKGSIEVNGVRYPIDGYASHERHVHCGTRYNAVKTLSARGVTWHSASAPGLQVIFLSRPSLGIAWCRVVTDAQTWDFSGPGCEHEIKETQFWVDPESRIQIPCAWRSSFRGPGGTLVIDATAFARSYYLWPHYRHGCTVLYWWLARARFSLHDAHGRELRSGDLQYIAHDNRLLYRQHRGD